MMVTMEKLKKNRVKVEIEVKGEKLKKLKLFKSCKLDPIYRRPLGKDEEPPVSGERTMDTIEVVNRWVIMEQYGVTRVEEDYLLFYAEQSFLEGGVPVFRVDDDGEIILYHYRPKTKSS
jgi:hypothetical protein